ILGLRMHEKGSGALGGLTLDLPGLAAVLGAEDCTEIADGPAATFVEEEDAVQRRVLAGRLQFPIGAGGLAGEDAGAGPAEEPGERGPFTGSQVLPASVVLKRPEGN